MNNVTAWWGAITGSLALAINGWNALRAEREMLDVVPCVIKPAATGMRFVVKVTNRSPFAVTIERVTLVVKIDGELMTRPLRHGLVPMEQTTKLEWHETATFFESVGSSVLMAAGDFHEAIVETSSGAMRKSSRFSRYRGKGINAVLNDAQP